MTQSDEKLELEIDRRYKKFLAATDEPTMRDWMTRMRTAISLRTLTRIAEMEQQKGLA